MKKIVIILVALAILLTIVGVASKSQPTISDCIGTIIVGRGWLAEATCVDMPPAITWIMLQNIETISK